MPNKEIIHPICLVCGESFETTSRKAKVCPKKKCKNASRYILYAEKYRTRYATNPEKKQEVELVDSICPMCRCPHKAETKRNFCEPCKQIIINKQIPDVESMRHSVYAP